MNTKETTPDLWVDITSGTWGTNPDRNIIRVATHDWTDGDWQVFDAHMSDDERQRYAEQYGGLPRHEQTPVAWYANYCQ